MTNLIPFALVGAGTGLLAGGMVAHAVRDPDMQQSFGMLKNMFDAFTAPSPPASTTPSSAPADDTPEVVTDIAVTSDEDN